MRSSRRLRPSSQPSSTALGDDRGHRRIPAQAWGEADLLDFAVRPFNPLLHKNPASVSSPWSASFVAWGSRVLSWYALRTTITNDAAIRPRDRLGKDCTAVVPNRMWIADLPYVRTWSGFVYIAFVTDVCSRRIVNWQASRSLATDLRFTPWNRPCGNAVDTGKASTATSITATAASNTCQSVTRNSSPSAVW